MSRGIALNIALAILVGAMIVSVYLGALGILPIESIRSLAEFYLSNTYNVFDKRFWSASPEAVNAILWDYRGLDTIYETVVLFLALIGCLALAFVTERIDIASKGEEVGLTPLAATCVRVIAILIVLIAIALAFRGYITPGGGFQGGAALAIAPLLIIAAYSARTAIARGFKLSTAGILRSIGLLSIALIALIPITLGGYLVQNQAKPWIGIGFSDRFLGIYTGGSLLLYNVSELMVVGMEFLTIFLLLSIALPGEER